MPGRDLEEQGTDAGTENTHYEDHLSPESVGEPSPEKLSEDVSVEETGQDQFLCVTVPIEFSSFLKIDDIIKCLVASHNHLIASFLDFS